MKSGECADYSLETRSLLLETLVEASNNDQVSPVENCPADRLLDHDTSLACAPIIKVEYREIGVRVPSRPPKKKKNPKRWNSFVVVRFFSFLFQEIIHGVCAFVILP
jgi:hypothetical protein